jgi:serine/threonine protein kinase/formylglycine-generating enzyme required for sulfatase activity
VNDSLDVAQQISTILASSINPDGFRWPETLGRYRIDQQLDRGNFGVVLRAWDPTLHRDVAIKVARPERLRQISASVYLREARTQARLSHRNIAQVHDCGELPGGGLYVVTKYYPGGTLAKLLAPGHHRRPESIAETIAQVADALAHAHAEGVIHRDVKPANILLDEDGSPVLTDFGLAMLVTDPEGKAGMIGSPAYMSPEQARGESHRVNQCADIYALGVVLFELLCGRRPYTSSHVKSVLQQIRESDIPRLRDINADLPAELERICNRAMQKLPSDRYQSAAEFADDLRSWARDESSPERPVAGRIAGTDSTDGGMPITPRGLRAFDRGDAGFFLELLPGLKDKSGLPESIRFWKQRIEPGGPAEPFRVGMLLGPSGSGKSSLVRAGLIPHLDSAVITTITTARATNLESRLLREIRAQTSVDHESLAETLAHIRQGGGLPPENKLLIVIDQFEQFLHRSEDLSRSELAAALRQCDSHRVQALLIVREDFVSAANQFMELLEEPLSQDANWAILDLFTPAHARKVLVAYGRALGALPVDALGREQSRFIDLAIDGLQEDGKLIPVRLALLAEMLKEQRWVPATLTRYGGMGGLAEAFLAQRLEGAAAHPLAKMHPQATRELLQMLLPEDDALIRRPAVAKTDLIDRVSHLVSPATSEKLLEAFDNDLKLVTTGTARLDRSSESANLQSASDSTTNDDQQRRQVHYQLTHDYLVPSLNRWLHRSEMQTMRGRAQFRLRELARLYRATPESRFVPNPLEYIWLRYWTRASEWDQPQRELMDRGRSQFTRRMLATTAALLFALGTLYFVERTRSAGRLIADLSASRTVDAVDAIRRSRGRGDVRGRLVANPQIVSHPLHRALVLIDDEYPNPSATELPHVDDLLDHLPTDHPEDIRSVTELIRTSRGDGPVGQHIEMAIDSLASQHQTEAQRSAAKQLNPVANRDRTLAKLALFSQLQPDWSEWPHLVDPILDLFVASPAVQRGAWIDSFAGIRSMLADAALQRFESDLRFQVDRQREAWVSVASRLCASDPQRLTELASWCDGRELENEILPGIADDRDPVSQAALRRFFELNPNRVVAPETPDRVSPDVWSDCLRTITAADGFMTSAGGYLLSMTEPEMATVLPVLQAAGLRPSSIVVAARPVESIGVGDDAPAPRFNSSWYRDTADWPKPKNRDFGHFIELLTSGERRGWQMFDDEPAAIRIQASNQLSVFGDRRPDLLLSQLRLGGGAAADLDRQEIESRIAGYQDRMERAANNQRAREYLVPRLSIEQWRLGSYEDCLQTLALSERIDQDESLQSTRIKALVGLGRLAEAKQFANRVGAGDANVPVAGDEDPLRNLKASDQVRLVEDDELVRRSDMLRDQLEQMIGSDDPPPGTADVFEYVRALGLAATRLETVDAQAAAIAMRAANDAIDYICNRPGFDLFGQFWLEPDLNRLRASGQFRRLARKRGFDVTVTGTWLQQQGFERLFVDPCDPRTHADHAAGWLARGYTMLSVDDVRVYGDGGRLVTSVFARPRDRLQRDQTERRRATLATLAAHLGEFGPLVEALSTPGTLQAETIDAAATSHIAINYLLDRLTGTDNRDLRYALLLTLGSIPTERFSPAMFERLKTESIRAWGDYDAGVSAAGKWCYAQHAPDNLNQLGVPPLAPDSRHRLLSDGRTTMVRIDPPQFVLMGTPADEPGLTDGELRHWITGLRSFEIGQTEVTVQQFEEFHGDATYNPAGQEHSYTKSIAPNQRSPQISVRFWDAMRYCQWKSEREGIPRDQWCYPDIWMANPQEYRLPADFLQRRGFRLPIEEEWEYAARGGIALARPFGQTARLMLQYAHVGASLDNMVTREVGRLKPNPFGLHDTLGNVSEWCQNIYAPWKIPAYGFARDVSLLAEGDLRPLQAEPITPDRPIAELQRHIIRGGNFTTAPEFVRCADRTRQSPEDKFYAIGFRICRTAP